MALRCVSSEAYLGKLRETLECHHEVLLLLGDADATQNQPHSRRHRAGGQCVAAAVERARHEVDGARQRAERIRRRLLYPLHGAVQQGLLRGVRPRKVDRVRGDNVDRRPRFLVADAAFRAHRQDTLKHLDAVYQIRTILAVQAHIRILDQLISDPPQPGARRHR